MIASGDADAAERQMAHHFERQHDHLAAHYPARLAEAVQWR